VLPEGGGPPIHIRLGLVCCVYGSICGWVSVLSVSLCVWNMGACDFCVGSSGHRAVCECAAKCVL
jgi:hypothetical protein